MLKSSKFTVSSESTSDKIICEQETDSEEELKEPILPSKLNSGAEVTGNTIAESKIDDVECIESKETGSVILVGYGKGLAVVGDTRPMKDYLKGLGGRFNRRLKFGEDYKVGWIFPSSVKEELEKYFADGESGAGIQGAPPSTDKDNDNDNDNVSPYLSKYSEKSYAVFGNTRPIKEQLKKLGCRFNSSLKDGTGTRPGDAPLSIWPSMDPKR
jgi:hypothetical protein